MVPSTRTQILAAADRLFSEKGYHNVSMRAIAAELGISVGNLNYYFPRKADLANALHARQRAQQARQLARLRQRGHVVVGGKDAAAFAAAAGGNVGGHDYDGIHALPSIGDMAPKAAHGAQAQWAAPKEKGCPLRTAPNCNHPVNFSGCPPPKEQEPSVALKPKHSSHSA